MEKENTQETRERGNKKRWNKREGRFEKGGER